MEEVITKKYWIRSKDYKSEYIQNLVSKIGLDSFSLVDKLTDSASRWVQSIYHHQSGTTLYVNHMNFLEIIGLEDKVDETFEDFKKFIGCAGYN